MMIINVNIFNLLLGNKNNVTNTKYFSTFYREYGLEC